jgi:trans-aconitate 2-methyltransferase
VQAGADLGCGTGELTRALAGRWPAAEIWGVDNSADMIGAARGVAVPPGLHFVEADLSRWEPPRPLDRIVSNAAFQWVPGHGELLKRLAGFLAPGGALAFQLPRSWEETAFRLREELLAEERWRAAAAVSAERFTVEAPSWYAERLLDLGLEAEVWETIYYHLLGGPAEVVEWMKGTAFRPILTVLAEPERRAFLADYTARVEAAYTRGPHGTWFPFRRLFAVAWKRTGSG